MADIFPSILAKTYEEFEERVKRVEPFFERAHLDVADGVAVPNTTINGYDAVNQVKTPLSFSAHLMVAHPENQLYNWYKTSVDCFFINFTAIKEYKDMCDIIHYNKRKVGMVINPDTEPYETYEYIEAVDYVQFMSVKPGFYGSPFLEETVGRISAFHAEFPDVPIYVDGGMNPENARKVASAGASVIIAGHYLFESENVGKALEELRRAVL